MSDDLDLPTAPEIVTHAVPVVLVFQVPVDQRADLDVRVAKVLEHSTAAEPFHELAFSIAWDDAERHQPDYEDREVRESIQFDGFDTNVHHHLGYDELRAMAEQAADHRHPVEVLPDGRHRVHVETSASADIVETWSVIAPAGIDDDDLYDAVLGDDSKGADIRCLYDRVVGGEADRDLVHIHRPEVTP